jgi:hypothetical protein
MAIHQKKDRAHEVDTTSTIKPVHLVELRDPNTSPSRRERGAIIRRAKLPVIGVCLVDDPHARQSPKRPRLPGEDAILHPRVMLDARRLRNCSPNRRCVPVERPRPWSYVTQVRTRRD